MKRIFRKIIVYVLLALLGWWALSRLNILPSLGGLFRAKPVTIENTAILVESVKKLSQLVTITVFDEVVVKQEKTESRSIGGPLNIPVQSTARLVLVGKGKVMAGINLAKLTEKDCFVKDDSVFVQLPPAEITEIIMNPSDFETFTEAGTWTPEDVTAVKIKARETMETRALQQKILQQAAAKSQQVMKGFLKLAGFKKITVVQR